MACDVMLAPYMARAPQTTKNIFTTVTIAEIGRDIEMTFPNAIPTAPHNPIAINVVAKLCLTLASPDR